MVSPAHSHNTKACVSLIFLIFSCKPILSFPPHKYFLGERSFLSSPLCGSGPHFLTFILRPSSLVLSFMVTLALLKHKSYSITTCLEPFCVNPCYPWTKYQSPSHDPKWSASHLPFRYSHDITYYMSSSRPLWQLPWDHWKQLCLAHLDNFSLKLSWIFIGAQCWINMDKWMRDYL